MFCHSVSPLNCEHRIYILGRITHIWRSDIVCAGHEPIKSPPTSITGKDQLDMFWVPPPFLCVHVCEMWISGRLYGCHVEGRWAGCLDGGSADGGEALEDSGGAEKKNKKQLASLSLWLHVKVGRGVGEGGGSLSKLLQGLDCNGLAMHMCLYLWNIYMFALVA